jgi:hypothetical protein
VALIAMSLGEYVMSVFLRFADLKAQRGRQLDDLKALD